MMVSDVRRFYENITYKSRPFVRDPDQMDRKLLYKIHQLSKPLQYMPCITSHPSLHYAVELAGVRV